MRTNKLSLMGALLMGGLLACGTVAMGQDAKDAQTGARAGRGGLSPERQLERMTEGLKLTDEQKPKVKAWIEEGTKKRAEVRDLPQDERREKGRAMMEAQDKKLKEILTADQYTKWEKMRAEMRPGRPGGAGAAAGEKKTDANGDASKKE
jgi:protein CpxP